MTFDTAPIVAIATAPGRASIGVVRLSGKNLKPAIVALFGRELTPRHAHYLPFTQADGSAIDEGIVLFFPAPHSYTGEDVFELQGHGGPVVMQMVLKRCLEAGADIGLRLAEPGEFTRRAFLNDKLDLAQAEAVADLIDASTEAAAKLALQSLSGAFSQTVEVLVEQLIELRALVEATLDFPEEEIEFLEQSDARGRLAAIRSSLDHVFEQSSQGAILRQGLNVVLAGPPNVGKSSLLNALAGSEVAIVTAIAGTTRDRVIETIQIEGIPLNIVDTAGIRHAEDEAVDEVEKIGIARTWEALEKADVVLQVLDAARGPTRADEAIAADLPTGVPRIQIWNKIDVSGHRPAREELPRLTQIYLSAGTRAGLDLLREELLKLAGWRDSQESLFLARERHLAALRLAREHLAHAAQYAEQNDRSLELFAEELRLARESLATITGRFTPDDLLGQIFSRFCIGK